jgi:hypothetical protein
MKEIRIIYLLSLLICNKVSSQNVELYLDTINIINIRRIDTISKKVSESSRIFYFNNTYYQANNYPFEVLKTKCSTKNKDKIFYEGYASITNAKSINRLDRKLKKNIYFRCDKMINKSNFTKQLANESMEIVNCLTNTQGGVFLLSDQKVIAAFIIIDCSFEGGVEDAVFCKDLLNIYKTPILLNVLVIIN